MNQFKNENISCGMDIFAGNMTVWYRRISDNRTHLLR